jgi:hypothetical protein
MTLDDVLGFLLGAALSLAMWLPVLGYLIGQVVVPLRLHGGWRIAALVPVPFMAYILYVTVVGLQHESNLWPLMLILLSPAALTYLLIVYFAGRTVGKPAGTGGGQAPAPSA